MRSLIKILIKGKKNSKRINKTIHSSLIINDGILKKKKKNKKTNKQTQQRNNQIYDKTTINNKSITA